jgi:hypothetical protein
MGTARLAVSVRFDRRENWCRISSAEAWWQTEAALAAYVTECAELPDGDRSDA